MKRVFFLLTVVGLAVTAACASSSGGGASADNRPRPAGPSRDVLTAEEIARSSATNAYDLVRQLRAHWLRRRGPSSIRDPGAGAVVVYLNGVRLGGADELHDIGIEDVREIEYIGGPDATMRFGTGHAGGAILVTTK